MLSLKVYHHNNFYLLSGFIMNIFIINFKSFLDGLYVLLYVLAYHQILLIILNLIDIHFHKDLLIFVIHFLPLIVTILKEKFYLK